MPVFIQDILPGMPVRIIVSGVWEAADRPCTIRATVDVPSDDFGSQMVGADAEGLMTWDEFITTMELLLNHVAISYRT
jgi:hypothetical protein